MKITNTLKALVAVGSLALFGGCASPGGMMAEDNRRWAVEMCRLEAVWSDYRHSDGSRCQEAESNARFYAGRADALERGVYDP